MIQNSEKVSSEYTLWHVAEPFQSFESAPLTGVPIFVLRIQDDIWLT
jgi:hypothetical protein